MTALLSHASKVWLGGKLGACQGDRDESVESDTDYLRMFRCTCIVEHVQSHHRIDWAIIGYESSAIAVCLIIQSLGSAIQSLSECHG